MGKRIKNLVSEAEQKLFTGRQDELSIFEEALRQDGEFKVLNIFGIGGIGKTFLLEEYTRICEEKGIPVAFVDAREVKDQVEIILTSKKQIVSFDKKAAGDFSDFDNAFKKIFKSLEKLLKTGALPKEVAAYIDTASAAAGSAGMGVAGSLLGPPGAIAGAGLGAIIGQTVGRLGIRGISKLTKGGLTIEEALFLINWNDNLSHNFTKGLNHVISRFGKLVFMVDTSEYLDIALDQWLRDKLFLELSVSSLLVFTGREPLCSKFFRWQRFRQLIKEHELTEFHEEESKEFLRKKGIVDVELVDYIVDFSRGLPWALGLFSDVVGLKGIRVEEELKRAPEMYDNVEIVVASLLRQIDDEELRNLITVSSVLRWFTEELLQFITKIDTYKLKELYRKLRHFSFIRAHMDGSLYIHDTVRAFIIEDLKASDNDKYISINKLAVEYFQKELISANRDVQKLLRAKLYHTLCFDEDEGIGFFHRLFEQLETYAGFSFKDSMLPEIVNFPFERKECKKWSIFCDGYQAMNAGHWELAQNQFETLLKERTLENRLQFHVWRALGELYIGRGKYWEAQALYEKLFEQQKIAQAGELEMARTLMQLANVCAILNQYEKAEQYGNGGIQICESQHDLAGKAWLLYSLGTNYRLKGYIKKAIAALDQSYQIFSNLGDEYCTAFIGIHLGRVYTLDGQLEKAREYLERSRDEFSQRIVSSYDKANTILFLGNIYRFQGRYEEAEQYYHEALNMHEDMDSQREIAPLLGSLGVVCYKQGKRAEALEYLQRSYDMKMEQGYDRGRAITLLYFGDYYVESSEWDKAIQYFRLSLELADECGAIYPQVASRVRLYKYYYVAGKDLAGISFELERAESLATECLYPHELARIQVIQGHISLDNNEFEKAQEYYSEACTNASGYNKYVIEEILGEINVKLNTISLREEVKAGALSIRQKMAQYGLADLNTSKEDL